MVYVFEGARNSGKTFLSQEVSKKLFVPRFQFDFGNYFGLLGLKSNGNNSAHAFSMGKEFMLMQMARDIKGIPDFIHDRGIMTCLAWGLFENRIDRLEVMKQAEFARSEGLFENVHIIYIDGKNPDKRQRNKDSWDFADAGSGERDAFEYVKSVFASKCIPFTVFKNNFDNDSLSGINKLVSNLLK
jgi:hypothetical protein